MANDKEYSENPPPFRVGVLLIDGFALMSYAATVEPLRAANILGASDYYQVCNIAAAGARAVSSGGAIIEADGAVGDARAFDLLLVVAGGDPASYRDAAVFNWLRRLERRGIRLGGVSGGPVILAQAGLMEDRHLTVHWEHAAALAEISPSMMIQRSLYVIDRDRVTCAGGIAPMDLMHALIAEHHGPEFARLVSDWFLHTDIRPSGGPQRGGLIERFGTTNRYILDAIAAMENHLADPLSLAQLSHFAGISQRQLNRLFGEKLGRTSMAFYRDLRLDKARNLLLNSPLGITEIAYASGFSNSSHLAKAYKAKFGRPPSSART